MDDNIKLNDPKDKNHLLNTESAEKSKDTLPAENQMQNQNSTENTEDIDDEDFEDDDEGGFILYTGQTY